VEVNTGDCKLRGKKSFIELDIGGPKNFFGEKNSCRKLSFVFGGKK